MARWLFKEEPSHYSFADLQRDGLASWDGVKNALAKQHLRRVKRGDEIFYYHTGNEKAIVALAVAAGDATEDQGQNSVRVKVKPVRRLQRPVTLSEIKADSQFAAWELTRISRLSIMPVTESIWRRVLALSERSAPATQPSDRMQRPPRKTRRIQK